MKKKKISRGEIVELVILFLPLIAFVGIGVAIKDLPLYSQEGIIYSTAVSAFSVICWTGIALYDFCTAFRSINGKIKKALYIVLIVLLMVLSVLTVYIRYDYTTLGKQANETTQAAKEADEASAIELCISAMEQWGKVNDRKIAVGFADCLYFALFSVIAAKKKRTDRESETDDSFSIDGDAATL